MESVENELNDKKSKKKSKREFLSDHEEVFVQNRQKYCASENKSPVKHHESEARPEESPVTKRKRKPEFETEESSFKKKKRNTESGNVESPVKTTETKTDSRNQEAPLMKKEKATNSINEQSPVKKAERKSESANEEAPFKKKKRNTESGLVESPVKTRKTKIYFENADAPFKGKERKTDFVNEESPVKKIDRKIDSASEQSPDRESKKISKNEKSLEIYIEIENEKKTKFGEAECEPVVRKEEKKMELGDILKDITDLSEPSCMDKILLYLEEIKEEDHLFMELLVDRLHGEIITWEQPWYQQSNSLSRPLKDASNENHSKTYRTDTICKAECDKIQMNWNKFRKLYQIPDKLICLARWKNKDKSRLPNTPEEQARRFVVAYLARGLERTIYQVFRHIMTYFGGTVKGAYSSDEEKIMKVCFMHHPNHSVTLLSMVLSREPRGIYKRLQQMFNGKPEKKRIKWTLPLATRLLVLILKYTKLPLEELKYKKIDKSVWLKLEKKFNHHYVHLQNFWYASLHVQVFLKENLKVNKLRKKVFKKLKTSSYQVWTDIRWKDLVNEFPDGLTHRFLYVISRSVVYKISKYLKKPLSEVADIALNKLRTHRYRKRRLRTLQFNENGELEAVKYDSSEVYQKKIND